MTEVNLNGQSLDIVHENIKKLKQLFPEIVTEDKVDFEKLQVALGNYMEKDNESYRFTWHGKSDAFRKSQTPSTGTLRPYPCEDESKNWDTTQNLYIEGDNLEVLKLLQKSYNNRIKMIYIDPPYNKDRDFIYPDKWSDTIKEYKNITGQLDAEDNVTSSDIESEGGKHTNWLNMIYPRLRLARNLLIDDGVIFIHIDDDELFNLKKVCDEVFGVKNFINKITVKTKVAGVSGSYLGNSLQNNVEEILLYSKNINSFTMFNKPVKKLELLNYINMMKLNEKSWKYVQVIKDAGDQTEVKRFKDGFGDEIILYKHTNYNFQSISKIAEDEFNGDLKKAYYCYIDKIFDTTNAQSSIREKVMNESSDIDTDLISIVYTPKSGKNSGKQIQLFYKGPKRRLFTWLKDTVVVEKDKIYKLDNKGNLWDDIQYNNLTKEGDIKFENGKKPISLIGDMISMTCSKDDIILDFFSGSSSTAHAVLQKNTEDSGKRKYIMVQLPENLDLLLEEADAISKPAIKETIQFLDSINKPHSLAEIGKERIRRAGESIKVELTQKYVEYQEKQESLLNDCGDERTMNPDDLDIGFKVFKLDDSNLKKWSIDVGEDFYKESKEEQNAILSEMLGFEVNNFVEGRSEIDVVYEIMIKYGLDLTYPIETYNFDGKNVYSIGYGGLIICLDDNINVELADKIVNLIKELGPSMVRVAVRDLSFNKDSAKTNFKETLKNGVYAYFDNRADKINKENQFKFITI